MDNFGVTAHNISLALSAVKSERIKQSSLISELAYEMCERFNSTDMSEFLAECGEVFRALVGDECGYMLPEKILYRLSQKLGRSITISDIIGASPQGECFAYQHNRYTDSAYEIMSKYFFDSTLVYTDDTDGVIDAVKSGRATYGIVPTADSSLGNIDSVLSRLAESAQVILLTVNMEQSDGKVLELSLVSGGINEKLYEKYDKLYLTMSFFPHDGVNVSDTLSCLEYFGLGICNIRFPDADGRTVVTVHGNYTKILLAIVYMSMFSPDFTIYGVRAYIDGGM